MEIDLHALPIPQWGLECPGCRYPLDGLPAHRCPECGRAVDVAALVRTWTRLRPPRFTGAERPLPDCGLGCRACGAALAGAPSLACRACGAEQDWCAVWPGEKWFAAEGALVRGVPGPILEVLLAAEQIPYVVKEERQLAQIVLGMPMSARIYVAREYFLDLLHALRRNELERAARQRDWGAWRCSGCGESNPANFELCWNCQAAGPAR